MKNIILLDAINLKLLWIFQGMEAKTRFGEVTINILDICYQGGGYLYWMDRTLSLEQTNQVVTSLPPALSQNPCNLGFLHSH